MEMYSEITFTLFHFRFKNYRDNAAKNINTEIAIIAKKTKLTALMLEIVIIVEFELI